MPAIVQLTEREIFQTILDHRTTKIADIRKIYKIKPDSDYHGLKLILSRYSTIKKRRRIKTGKLSDYMLEHVRDPEVTCLITQEDTTTPHDESEEESTDDDDNDDEDMTDAEEHADGGGKKVKKSWDELKPRSRRKITNSIKQEIESVASAYNTSPQVVAKYLYRKMTKKTPSTSK